MPVANFLHRGARNASGISQGESLFAVHASQDAFECMEIHDEITPNSGSLTEKGQDGNDLTTQKGVTIADTIPAMATRTPSKTILAENLSRLMVSTWSLNSNPKLADRATLGLGTIGRILHAEVNANLETLDKLASAFGVKPWELLVSQKEQASQTQIPLIMGEPVATEPPKVEAVVVAPAVPAQPQEATSIAQELAALLDMVPGRIDRIRAFNAATEAILRISSGHETPPSDGPSKSETAKK